MTEQKQRKTVLGVASFGGHLVQLRRILEPLGAGSDVHYVTTDAKGVPSEGSERYHLTEDFSRKSPWRLITAFRQLRRVIREVKPDVIISTGAAPGLVAILAGRLAGVKTLWIDSIANAGKLSLSGKLAQHIADEVITQWPELATDRVHYHGNVL